VLEAGACGATGLGTQKAADEVDAEVKAGLTSYRLRSGIRDDH
jgi:hypothetical protein